MELTRKLQIELAAQLFTCIADRLKSINGRRYYRAIEVILYKQTAVGRDSARKRLLYTNWRELKVQVEDQQHIDNESSDESKIDLLLVKIAHLLFKFSLKETSLIEPIEQKDLYKELEELVEYPFADSLVYLQEGGFARLEIRGRRLLIDERPVRIIAAANSTYFPGETRREIPFVRECFRKAGLSLAPQAAHEFIRGYSQNHVKRLELFSNAFGFIPENAVLAFDGNVHGGMGSGGIGYLCFKRPASSEDYWPTKRYLKESGDTEECYFVVY